MWLIIGLVFLALLLNFAVVSVSAHSLGEKFTDTLQVPVYSSAVALVLVNLLVVRLRGASLKEILSVAGRSVKSKPSTFILAFLGMAVFYTATTALNEYSYIPDWVPYGPKIFTPSDPNFTVYALIWRLNENWSINFNEIHATYFLAISITFALTMTLLKANLKRVEACSMRAGKNRKSAAQATLSYKLKLSIGAGFGGIISLFAAFSCCIPAFAIYVIPSVFFTIIPFEDSFGSIGVAAMIANSLYLTDKLCIKKNISSKNRVNSGDNKTRGVVM